ncbi:hypothetical protein LQ954_14055 [Sphingomonas sp. IC-11]|uniref:hypothetical protein n=1 Tax=Sphingomonas sp. IC-11 TaxID=2898528 RepID=UPI001E33A356|nr:hypothetical protein [Sphingomonas sp. IC-11]MCD2317267.1 hypothetical protein [Sphingomonas sp. IC-11]
MSEAEDLVIRLLTAAGMIMEDTAEAAVIRIGDIRTDVRVAVVLAAGEDTAVLARAAAIITRRFAQSSGS